MDDIIYIPRTEVTVVNKVKDSKFYGHIARVSEVKDVKDFIEGIRDEYHDASHNVSAYRIGTGDNIEEYYDDDGEPAGSSGPPVLRIIKGEELSNTVIVVTRYFGGTELGIGGLIRAYGDTARMVIGEAGKHKARLIYKLKAISPYKQLGTLMGQIEAAKGRILDTTYDEHGGSVSFLLRPARYDSFLETMQEMGGGEIKLKLIKKYYS